MNSTCQFIAHLQQAELFSLIKSVILALLGFYLAKLISNKSAAFISRYASSQQTMILQKSIYFLVLTLFLVTALQQLGFKLSVLLGSAGIATAAVAVASQSSISNIISGLFLILEKSFQIGDKIKVGSTLGIISSIDLLSVKVITPNNTLIRIPNETMLKNEITNLTRFESRRQDLQFTVSSKEKLAPVKSLLMQAALNNEYSLKVPSPTVVIKQIGNGHINLQLSIWVNQENYDVLHDLIFQQVIALAEQKNISL